MAFFIQRSNIDEANTILWQKVNKLDGFYFMEQDFDWVKNDNSVKMEYFIEDGIHLIKVIKDLLIPL